MKGIALLLLAPACLLGATASPHMWADESGQVRQRWEQHAAYMEETSDDLVVGMTPEGSVWLWNYNKARGIAKANPVTGAPAGQFDDWIKAKAQWDKYLAGDSTQASDPGPCPDDLVKLVGCEPPPFYRKYEQTTYLVRFDDGVAVQMRDHHPVPDRYPYFRFPQGVEYDGTPLSKWKPDDLKAQFQRAGLIPSEQKVMMAVSTLEGGFDSLNTYDTGYVSAGFVQFASLQEGSGSLGEMLYEMKSANPGEFKAYFHDFGVDVDDNKALAVMDLANGGELHGQDAAAAIINDKRLSAVFIHAGQKSDAYRIAQILFAKKRFYPAEDALTITTRQGTLTCKIKDVLRSEAGMATAMDRKVNVGNLRALPSLLQMVADSTGVSTVDDLAAKESLVLQSLTYRHDFTKDSWLTQPAPVDRPASLGDRHKSKRSGRKK
ncbi:MAG: hypothetical protein JSS72_05350 [Armatimonadetes bacterium]|nr:hypothetical protein [Armatimonadota bacterium]